MNLTVLLFNEFETLDVFGPVEILGWLKGEMNISFVSLTGGTIVSSQQVPVVTSELNSIDKNQEYIFLIPGGLGTRREIENETLLNVIKKLSGRAKFILSVCTGAALLAKAGVLDNKKATTNKKAFDWVVEQNTGVTWFKKARWVKDGNIYTSSGISAGMDMTLGFVGDVYGLEVAENISQIMEYIWNKNSEDDIFSAP